MINLPTKIHDKYQQYHLKNHYNKSMTKQFKYMYMDLENIVAEIRALNIVSFFILICSYY